MSIPVSPVEADEEDSLLTRKLQDKSTASLLPNLPSSFTASPHTAQLHRVVVVVELCLFCRRGAAQLAARRPKLPRPLRPTLRKRSHNKEVPLAPPHPPSSNPITQRQRQGPLGALPQCARSPVEPGVQELWPRGLQSRNCALCAAEICTVISSAARVRRLRVADRPGPDRLRCRRVSGLNGTEMGKSEAGLLLLRITNMLTSRPSSKHRMLMQKNLQNSEVTGRCDSQQS